MHDDVVVDPNHEPFGGIRLTVAAGYCGAWGPDSHTGCGEVDAHYFADDGCCEGEGVGEFWVVFETLKGKIGVGS